LGVVVSGRIPASFIVKNSRDYKLSKPRATHAAQETFYTNPA
jgi:hypothetical protein